MPEEERHKKRNNEKDSGHVPVAQRGSCYGQHGRNQDIWNALFDYAHVNQLVDPALPRSVLLTSKGTRNFGSTSPSIVNFKATALGSFSDLSSDSSDIATFLSTSDL